MGEVLIENKIYVAELFGSDLQGNDLYKLEPLKQIGNATFVKVTPEFKRGDILKSNQGTGRIVIFNEYTSDNYFESIYSTIPSSDKGWLKGWLKESFRHATEEEKQKFFDELKVDGKRWNAEKLIVEDIPQPRFRAGDKVTLKSGCASKSNLIYRSSFDEYIGKELTVIDYTERGNVRCNNLFCFAEDWLELYVEKQHPKFKAGDEVRIKKGISSKTHRNIFPAFVREMDDCIGKKLIIKNTIWYARGVYLYSVDNSVDNSIYNFLEDWIEPYVEELKSGDLAIFWDNVYSYPLIRLYDTKTDDGRGHFDNSGTVWDNAIKWDDTKEQFEKFLRGEI